ncbi:hypothetical protein HON36_00115 [Candidatus Parcubacteria bacterium]|jgi:Fic family protein|nr:hypothetical protein [Candidatus Parcubacteria bacterium]MBT7228303.1 hypothetical protein [Candidatus Parcubacteria bacterium]
MNGFEGQSKENVSYPENLTPQDIALVYRQCEIQHATSVEQLEGFANAYSKAKELAQTREKLDQLTPEQIEGLILELGALTEKRNQKGFRIVPVTFANGSRAIEADKIPRAIQTFAQGFKSFLENPTEDERLNTVLLYKQFEEIHPFEDGNGRVGDLLWKILESKKTKQWPEKLPPDVFGENK